MAGGQIIVSSAKGRGSTFTMQVPFTWAESSANPFQSPPISTPFSEIPGPLPALHLPKKYEIGGPSLTSQVGTLAAPTSYFPLPTPIHTPGCNTDVVTESVSGASTQSSVTTPPYTSEESASQRVPPSRSSSFISTNNPIVVLAADDNDINIRVLENRVKKMGHAIIVSRDGQDCYEKFVANHQSVNFVLMDIDVSRISHIQTVLNQYVSPANLARLRCQWLMGSNQHG